MKNECRLSIDLYYSEDVGNWSLRPTDVDQANAIANGCRRTLERLGKLSVLMQAVRVTFSTFGSNSDSLPPGPVFTFYWKDHLGNKRSHGTDYRFMGSGDRKGHPIPSADDIAEELCADHMSLKSEVQEHFANVKQRLEGLIAAAAAIRAG